MHSYLWNLSRYFFVQLKSFNVKRLRYELKIRGIDTNGLKKECLQDWLKKALAERVVIQIELTRTNRAGAAVTFAGISKVRSLGNIELWIYTRSRTDKSSRASCANSARSRDRNYSRQIQLRRNFPAMRIHWQSDSSSPKERWGCAKNCIRSNFYEYNCSRKRVPESRFLDETWAGYIELTSRLVGTVSADITLGTVDVVFRSQGASCKCGESRFQLSWFHRFHSCTTETVCWPLHPAWNCARTWLLAVFTTQNRSTSFRCAQNRLCGWRRNGRFLTSQLTSMLIFAFFAWISMMSTTKKWATSTSATSSEIPTAAIIGFAKQSGGGLCTSGESASNW